MATITETQTWTIEVETNEPLIISTVEEGIEIKGVGDECVEVSFCELAALVEVITKAQTVLAQ